MRVRLECIHSETIVASGFQYPGLLMASYYLRDGLLHTRKGIASFEKQLPTNSPLSSSYQMTTPATLYFYVSGVSSRSIFVYARDMQGGGGQVTIAARAFNAVGWGSIDMNYLPSTIEINYDYSAWSSTLDINERVEWVGHLEANRPYILATLRLLPPALKRPLGGYVDVALPLTVEWTAPIEQVQARLTFYQNGVAVHTITVGSTTRTYTVPADTLDRMKSLQWTAQIADIDGVWSDNAALVTLTTIPAAPEQPDLIRPVGLILDTATEIAFRWAHRSSDGSTQGSARLEISGNRGATWQTHMLGPQSEYIVPSNTFTPGTYLWRVQTYNINNIASPISITAEFYVYGRPNPPTITEITPDTAKPTIFWGSSDQTAYEIEVSQNDAVIYYRYVVGNDREHTVSDFLDDGRYIVRLRVISGYGLISDWAEAPMFVSTYKPGTPSIFVAESRDCNKIVVKKSGEDEISFILLYRTRLDAPHADGHFDDTKTVIIADVETQNFTFDDFSAASGARYAYFARAVTPNNTFADSSRAVGVHRIRGSVFSLAASPGEYRVNILYNIDAPVSRNNAFALDGTAIHYVGRKLPVYEYAEFLTSNWTLNAMFETDEQLKTFKQLVQARDIILYRDQYGRKMYINILNNSTTPDRIGVKFTLHFEEVDYHE